MQHSTTPLRRSARNNTPPIPPTNQKPYDLDSEGEDSEHSDDSSLGSKSREDSEPSKQPDDKSISDDQIPEKSHDSSLVSTSSKDLELSKKSDNKPSYKAKDEMSKSSESKDEMSKSTESKVCFPERVNKIVPLVKNVKLKLLEPKKINELWKSEQGTLDLRCSRTNVLVVLSIGVNNKNFEFKGYGKKDMGAKRDVGPWSRSFIVGDPLSEPDNNTFMFLEGGGYASNLWLYPQTKQLRDTGDFRE